MSKVTKFILAPVVAIMLMASLFLVVGCGNKAPLISPYNAFDAVAKVIEEAGNTKTLQDATAEKPEEITAKLDATKKAITIISVKYNTTTSNGSTTLGTKDEENQVQIVIERDTLKTEWAGSFKTATGDRVIWTEQSLGLIENIGVLAQGTSGDLTGAAVAISTRLSGALQAFEKAIKDIENYGNIKLDILNLRTEYNVAIYIGDAKPTTQA